MNCTIGIIESNRQINNDINNIVDRAKNNEFNNSNIELVWEFSNQDFSYKIMFTIANDFSEEFYNQMLQFKYNLDNRIDCELVIQSNGSNCQATGGTTFVLKDDIFKIIVASYSGDRNNVYKTTDSFFSIRYNHSIINTFNSMFKIIDVIKNW